MAEYIDRQAAITGIDKMLGKYYESDDTKAAEVADDCRFVLEKIKPADVAPVVHARWKIVRDESFSRTVLCTACNDVFYYVKRGQLNIDKKKYCPNCGAIMGGKE